MINNLMKRERNALVKIINSVLAEKAYERFIKR